MTRRGLFYHRRRCLAHRLRLIDCQACLPPEDRELLQLVVLRRRLLPYERRVSPRRHPPSWAEALRRARRTSRNP